MKEQFKRTELIFGENSTEILNNMRVAVFGIGGVGGYVVEALARAGIGTIDLFDADTVDITNLNRQIIASHSTLNKSKVSVARNRIKDINPEIIVNEFFLFYSPENSKEIDLSVYDYVVDAIDSVPSKLELICNAKLANVPIISCMGTGNKTDPTRLEVADIFKTSVCPLAKVMRYELKKRNIKSLKVVYSKELPQKPMDNSTTIGSTPFVPGVAGLIIAGVVIKDLLKFN